MMLNNFLNIAKIQRELKPITINNHRQTVIFYLSLIIHVYSSHHVPILNQQFLVLREYQQVL